MKYWVKEADVDGFRCDAAGMIPAQRCDGEPGNRWYCMRNPISILTDK